MSRNVMAKFCQDLHMSVFNWTSCGRCFWPIVGILREKRSTPDVLSIFTYVDPTSILGLNTSTEAFILYFDGKCTAVCYAADADRM